MKQPDGWFFEARMPFGWSKHAWFQGNIWVSEALLGDLELLEWP